MKHSRLDLSAYSSFTGVKLYVLFLCLACVRQYSYGQVNNPLGLSYVYVGGGFGLGRSATPTGCSVNFIHESEWGGSFSFKHSALPAQELPHDYNPGVIRSLFSLKPGKAPDDFLEFVSFMAVREFHTRHATLRFGLEAGPSIVTYKKAVFTRSGGFLADNYDVTYVKSESVGLSLRGKMELPFGRAMGLELAVFANLNQWSPLAGFEVYFTLGKVRESPGPRNTGQDESGPSQHK